MSSTPTGKPGVPAARPKPVASASAAAKAAMNATGSFSGDQLLADSTSFPPPYEAAILYAADYYDAAQDVLKEYLKTNEGKASVRTWLMLFDLYHLTNNRKEFDALSMLFTVKFERSPPNWAESTDNADPRRKEKRERKDFFLMTPAADGALLAEIDKFEAFANEMGSCRVDFARIKGMLSEESELLAIVFQRLRKSKIPLWFNGLDDFAALLKQCINEKTGLPLDESQGYWSLLFELYILDGKLNEYEELGLEYAVAFEMSPPAWEVVLRPTNSEGTLAPVGTVVAASTTPAEVPVGGFPLKGVVSATSRDMLHQLSVHATSVKQEVVVDMTALLRIDFAAVGLFFETVRSIHLSQKRVILTNLNELVAALLEVFGMPKHAILMRKKAS
jgi:anti-anti-sigma regulatory factor